MTRKDFELIAAAISKVVSGTTENSAGGAAARHHTLTIVALTLADALATTNPAFDRDRFLKASGVTP